MELRPAVAFFGGSAGPGELLVLFALILILFGPRRLPEIARMIGRSLSELRRASQDFRNQVMHIADEEPDRADRLLSPSAESLPRLTEIKEPTADAAQTSNVAEPQGPDQGPGGGRPA